MRSRARALDAGPHLRIAYRMMIMLFTANVKRRLPRGRAKGLQPGRGQEAGHPGDVFQLRAMLGTRQNDGLPAILLRNRGQCDERHSQARCDGQRANPGCFPHSFEISLIYCRYSGARNVLRPEYAAGHDYSPMVCFPIAPFPCPFDKPSGPPQCCGGPPFAWVNGYRRPSGPRTWCRSRAVCARCGCRR